MELNTYAELAARTQPKPGENHFFGTHWDHNDPDKFRRNVDLVHGIFGLMTETGELATTVKKMFAYGTYSDPDEYAKARANLIAELGDALWYFPLICRALGVDLDLVARVNINKLRKRYPEGYTDRAAVTRADNPTLEGEAALVGESLETRASIAGLIAERLVGNDGLGSFQINDGKGRTFLVNITDVTTHDQTAPLPGIDNDGLRSPGLYVQQVGRGTRPEGKE